MKVTGTVEHEFYVFRSWLYPEASAENGRGRRNGTARRKGAVRDAYKNEIEHEHRDAFQEN